MAIDVHGFISVNMHKEERLLESAWLRNVTSEEYRAAVLYLLELVVDNAIHFWLIDSRKLSNVAFADQQWVKRVATPFIKASELRKFARVLTEDVFNYISFENVLQDIIEEHDTRLVIAQFTSAESALDWLLMDAGEY